MARPQHDWYLAEWLAHFEKKPADLVNALDWNKARESLMRRGKQPYTRDAVNEIAAYLHLEPYELLLPPERAMALRQYRASAETVIAAVPAPEPINIHDVKYERAKGARRDTKRKTGTNG